MDPLIQLQKFIRDLLVYDHELIRRGRNNFEQEDFNTTYIVVDAIAPSRNLTRGQTYDGGNEVMQYDLRRFIPATIDYYGPDAFDLAQKFDLMCRTQQALELQKTHGITVYAVGNTTNVAQLAGSDYGKRVQQELNIGYTVTTDVDTLRIDTAQTDITAD